MTFTQRQKSIRVILMVLLASLVGCASHEVAPKEPERFAWLDEAESMKGLRGIVVMPYPEVMGSEKCYSMQRPYEVNYVFWNGWIRSVTKNYLGHLISDRWISPKQMSFPPERIRTVEQWRKELGAE